jgi:hypothetical protein
VAALTAAFGGSVAAINEPQRAPAAAASQPAVVAAGKAEEPVAAAAAAAAAVKTEVVTPPTPTAAAAVTAPVAPSAPQAAAAAAAQGDGSGGGDADSTIAPRSLPEYSTLVAAEAALWGLAAHVSLPVRQMQQLTQAVLQLAAVDRAAAQARTAAAAAQRFEADYACLRAWALTGSRDMVLNAFDQLLQHVLQ